MLIYLIAILLFALINSNENATKNVSENFEIIIKMLVVRWINYSYYIFHHMIAKFP